MDPKINVHDANFDEAILQSEIPVLIDFWAEWCAPCKALLPVFAELEKEYTGRVKFVKINVESEACRKTVEKYNILSVPTLILFKDGQPEVTHIGAASKSKMQAWLESHI